MCSTTCKIRSTPCKICSIKQSYPQVIPRVIPKKVLPTAKCAVPPCKTCSTHCKIRSTPCKICSTKQSYPQVIPQKVLHNAKHAVPHAKYAVPNAKHAVSTVKYAVPNAKHAVPHAKYAVQNKVIPKLSTELSPMDLSKKNRLEK